MLSFAIQYCVLFIWFVVDLVLRIKEAGEESGLALGVLAVCSIRTRFCVLGAVPVAGGASVPSVPRSPGTTPRERGAAHGPLHPAFYFHSLFVVRMHVPWETYSVWLIGPSSFALCLDYLSSPPFSLSVSFFLRRRRSLFFFFSLSLRRWGNPNPFLEFGVPLVLLRPQRSTAPTPSSSTLPTRYP